VLQQNTNLATTNWTTVMTIPTMTNGSNRLTLAASGARAFFRLAQTQSPPLAIAPAGANATVIWSSAFTGYTLLQSPSLTPPNWSPTTNVPNIVGGQYRVTLSPVAGSRFLRLIQ
jgi:hypothetical protein